MSRWLHAAHYADRAVQELVSVVENVELARDIYRVRFECPPIARRIVPGQFLMVRLGGRDDPLLGRPLALYDTVLSPAGEPVGIDVVYLVGGKFTQHLAEAVPGVKLDVWGPLGNGFEPQPVEHLIMVAGGIGQTPFMALAKEQLSRSRYGDPPRQVRPCAKVTFCYGARSGGLLAGADDFERIGIDVHLSTEDGSRGYHGLVTDVLRRVLDQTSGPHAIVCCGPEPMMEAVSKMAHGAGVPCRVSLETPMACGIGICFTCVAKVRGSDGTWDYKRTCVEGPVFDAASIQW